MISPIATALLLPLLVRSAVAQTTIQKIFFASPSNDDAFVGSVVANANGLTTYAIACTSGTYSCFTGSTITVTEGSSTFALALVTNSDGAEVSARETCTVSGTTSATCVVTASVSLDGTSTETSTTTTLGTADLHTHPVTITAGAELLGSSGGGGAPTSATSGNAAPMVTGMGVVGAAVMGLAVLL